MGKETERKLEVGDLQLLDCILCDREVRGCMERDFSYVQMETTYFDTPEHTLSKSRRMLRLRRENEKSVVCIKTAGDGVSRGEWELEGEYLEDTVPLLVKQGAPAEIQALLESEALSPVCGARFTRITAPLATDGCRFAICGDIGELFGGTKKLPLCELELELKEGSAEPMLAFGRMLMERYRLSEEPKSKVARAMALRI